MRGCTPRTQPLTQTMTKRPTMKHTSKPAKSGPSETEKKDTNNCPFPVV